MNKGKYYPLFVTAGIFLVLFTVGKYAQGMWEPVALIMFYVAVGEAFNIFLGFTGYVNFGYVVFMGLGSYGMALVVSNSAMAGLGLWILIPGFLLASLMAGILAAGVGAIALRLRGAYFAIATIGVNQGVKFFIEGAKIWGGSEGIIISKPLKVVLGQHLANSVTTFWADFLVFLIALLTAVITIIFLHTRIGYGLIALREDEDAAKVMGVDTTKYKNIAFLVSSVLAALVGATAWCLKTTYVFPEDVFALSYTVDAIVIVMMGGAGTLLGPVVGGLIYGILKYWLGIILPGFQLLILAPFIIIIIIVFPEGIVGVLKKRLRGKKLEKFIA